MIHVKNLNPRMKFRNTEYELRDGFFVCTNDLIDRLEREKAKLETKPRRVNIMAMQDESVPRIQL